MLLVIPDAAQPRSGTSFRRMHMNEVPGLASLARDDESVATLT